MSEDKKNKYVLIPLETLLIFFMGFILMKHGLVYKGL